MRVAYDEQIFLFQKQGGISRYFANLIADMHGTNTLGVTVDLPFRRVWNDYAATDLRQYGVKMGPQTWAPYPLVAASLLRPKRQAAVDIVHHTFYHSRFLRDFPGAKKVVTLYDMIPERFPDAVSGKVHMAKSEYFHRADLLIAISESTKRDAISAYGEPRHPIQVIPLGVGEEFESGGLASPGLPDDYVLYIGQRAGYKDFDLLLQAFAQVVKKYSDLHLVAVGGGPFTSPERERISDLDLTERVTQSYVKDQYLPGTYAQAKLFVMPSRYEGFGIPILESMAAGTPTIAADASSFPEVGGDAIRYFPPGELEALTDAIDSVLGDESESDRLSALGRRRAKDFTWSKTAEMTAVAYQKLLS